MGTDHSALKFKDDSPINTVDKLKSLLNMLDIEIEEEWSSVSSIGTYSLRINLKGTNVGSNGKGMTRDYARASAYAEFIERLQNMKLQPNSVLTNVFRNIKDGFYMFENEKWLSAEELVEEDNSFIRMLVQNNLTEVTNKEKTIEFLKLQQKMDYNLSRQKNKFLCIPYYSIKEKRYVNIPYFLLNLYYGSNGMCAGNSMEEALVQGVSEIFERMAQKRILKEYIELPDVPEEYVKKVSYVYDMYKQMKENTYINIMIKDCSFNGKYPVVALIVYEKNTGRFGVKVGSHPDYGIAMERLFTEAAQGIDIKDYAKKTLFDFLNTEVATRSNVLNSFKTGDSHFPHQMFGDRGTFKFVEPKAVSNKSNRELLKDMFKIIGDEEKDILIHDCSYLGFPSYHIIVPGFSEMNDVEQICIDAENTRFHLQPFIWNPAEINKSNVNYLIGIVKYYSSSIMENSIKDIAGYLGSEDYPAKEFNMDNFYYLAMCYIVAGRYKEAEQQLLMMQHSAVFRGKEVDPWYLAVRLYAQGMGVYNEHQHVMEYISKLFDADIAKRVEDVFSDKEKVFEKQYPKVDFSGEDRARQLSAFRKFENLCTEYRRYQREHPMAQEKLSKAIEDVIN